MRLVLVFAFFFAFVLLSSALALTVDEAYKSIPHRRMEYSAAKSTLPSNVSRELEKLFKLSDEALVGRIETMKGLQQNHTDVFSAYQTKIEKVISGLDEIKDPELAQLTTLLKNAIKSQGEYFSNWHSALVSGQSYHSVGSDTDVRNASSSLQQLYSMLTQKYPKEHPDNLDSFYQHLCALDFL